MVRKNSLRQFNKKKCHRVGRIKLDLKKFLESWLGKILPEKNSLINRILCKLPVNSHSASLTFTNNKTTKFSDWTYQECICSTNWLTYIFLYLASTTKQCLKARQIELEYVLVKLTHCQSIDDWLHSPKENPIIIIYSIILFSILIDLDRQQHVTHDVTNICNTAWIQEWKENIRTWQSHMMIDETACNSFPLNVQK